MRTRNNRIHFYLTDEEYISLESKVKLAGCSREEFLRNLINGCVIKAAPPMDYYEIIIQLRRIGSNINQILKLANAKGIIITGELRKALEENRKIEKALWQAVTPEKQ